MSDVFTKAKRSEVMARLRSLRRTTARQARIRGCGNRETELALAKLLQRLAVY